MRRRLRRIADLRWRTGGALLVGLLGAMSLVVGLFVLLVGSLHLSGVIALHEPLFDAGL